jgi:hypothetical protein
MFYKMFEDCCWCLAIGCIGVSRFFIYMKMPKLAWAFIDIGDCIADYFDPNGERF